MPFEEFDIFLIEEIEFRQEEAIEVLEHEGCLCLLGWGKPTPVEVGLDDAIALELLRSGVKVDRLVSDDSRKAGIPPR